MILQRFTLADGLWTCPGCGAQLRGDEQGTRMEHRDGCPEIVRPRARRPAREVLERCQWCFKRNRTASEWEQKNLHGIWHRLCTGCANKRLRNPYNALLGMRKVGSEEDVPDA